jgi:hypothetical protein
MINTNLHLYAFTMLLFRKDPDAIGYFIANLSI